MWLDCMKANQISEGETQYMNLLKLDSLQKHWMTGAHHFMSHKLYISFLSKAAAVTHSFLIRKLTTAIKAAASRIATTHPAMAMNVSPYLSSRQTHTHIHTQQQSS